MISDDMERFASKAMRDVRKQYVSHFQAIERLPHAGVNQIENLSRPASAVSDLLRGFIGEGRNVVSIAPDFRRVQIPGGAVRTFRVLS